ncbi:MAG: hypothetical protein HQL31_09630 [Planctomycetes bacterium]|nr:hypothetical protein [Planctomycetota bacterium]
MNPDVPGAANLPEFREAQAAALALPKTAMAVATDIGLPNDLHPTNMQDAGMRLALLAEMNVYGKDILGASPLFDRLSAEGTQVRVWFKYAKGGLAARGGLPLRGFEVADAKGVFAPASAVIDGETVVVSNAGIPAPTALRYNWAHNPDGNLVNSADLPAAPFRCAVP